MISDITSRFDLCPRSESDYVRLFITPNLGQACLIFDPLRKLEIEKYILHDQLHPDDVVRLTATGIARLVFRGSLNGRKGAVHRQ